MSRDNIIYLISVTYTTDEIGQRIPLEESRKLFCGISSVSASEFFEAGRSGMNAQYRATVAKEEYHGETIAELNGKRYGVYRTYIGSGEDIELYLETKAGV